jgi:transposase
MAEPECAGCRALLRRVAELESIVARLEATIHDLQQRLGQNSSNSSLPPSANPPQAPKPVIKTPTGRKPGGQPGHPGHTHQRLPAEQLKEVIIHLPDMCARCQTALSTEPAAHDPEPTWHQVVELPAQLAEVTEHQAHGRTCPGCGSVTWGRIPDDIRARVYGPRLSATVAYLSGSPHVSKRGIEEVVIDIFGVPMALGTIANLEQEMSMALAAAHTEARLAVQNADSKNVDETGWKEAGKRRWLWAAANVFAVCFVIHASRGAAGLIALLGRRIRGIIHSDRWSVYGRLRVVRRQLCWAHLKRDFQKCVDRGGAAKEIGEVGLATVAMIFDLWHTFRGGGCSRRHFQEEIIYCRDNLREQLERSCACADAKTAVFCENLLALEPALWTFVYKKGVEPTNNHIERLLRSAVLWRKNAFGCHSESGCRFVERILTVVGTLRLQKRPVLEYLHQAIAAHRHGQPAPQLLGGA